MGKPVLILGKSGSGKSASLRNFKKGEVGILSVVDKPLPFRNVNNIPIIKNASYKVITETLVKNSLKCYVIDDSQYLMVFDLFERANIKGYDKFTEMALSLYNLLQTILRKTSEDTIVYLLHHTEETEYGIKAKTVGKMIDEKLTLEGLSAIVIGCCYTEEGYRFVTQTSGRDTFKTPMDMFEEKYIDNDLKAVDKTIRAYYGFDREVKENEQTK